MCKGKHMDMEKLVKWGKRVSETELSHLKSWWKLKYGHIFLPFSQNGIDEHTRQRKYTKR